MFWQVMQHSYEQTIHEYRVYHEIIEHVCGLQDFDISADASA